jgi:hypothetical protein
VIDAPNLRLLLLRTEGLADAAPILADFFEVSGAVALPQVNVSAEKDYAASYRELVATLRPDPDVIDRAYASRLVRHFYTADEIAGFRDRWSS